MDEKDMKGAGVLNKATSWTDIELSNQIRALRLVLTYLHWRGDCELVCSPLRIELTMFEDMMYLRNHSH